MVAKTHVVDLFDRPRGESVTASFLTREDLLVDHDHIEAFGGEPISSRGPRRTSPNNQNIMMLFHGAVRSGQGARPATSLMNELGRSAGDHDFGVGSSSQTWGGANTEFRTIKSHGSVFETQEDFAFGAAPLFVLFSPLTGFIST